MSRSRAAVLRSALGGDGLRAIPVTVAFAVSGGSTVAFGLVAANQLPVDAYGVLASNQFLALACAQVVATSLGPAIAHAVAPTRTVPMVARGALLLASIAAGMVAFGLAAAGLGGGGPTDWILTGAAASAYGLYLAQRTILVTVGRERRAAGLEVVGSVGLVLLALAFGFWPRSLLLAYPIAYGVYCLVGLRRVPVGRARLEPREVAHFAGFAFAGTYAGIALVPVAVVVSGQLVDAVDVSRLAVAATYVLPLALVPQAASAVVFGRYARARTRSVDVLANAVPRLGIVVVVSIALAVCLAPTVLAVFWGATYRDAADIAAVLIAGMGLRLVTTPIGLALSATGRIRVNAVVSCISLAFALCVVASLAGPFGAVGIAIGISAGNAVTGVALACVARQWFGLPLGRSLCLLPVCLVALPMPAPAMVTNLALLVATAAVVAYLVTVIRRRAGFEADVPSSGRHAEATQSADVGPVRA